MLGVITPAKKRVMVASREHKLSHFYSLFKEGQSVLDVGVSAESKKGLPARNYFLKHYRYNPETYTGVGVQDLSGLPAMFPGKYFVQYSGRIFPFGTKEFDWAFSNAVIEHVGDSDAQLLFVNEMMRVANDVFFTTPNKYFPIESHSNVLFLHWNDALFYRWCKRFKKSINRHKLQLFSFGELRDLLRASDATYFTIYRNRLFGVTMTFTVICSDRDESVPT